MSLKIGLVLSGGGARGAYQLGVMFAIYKHGFYRHVQALSGASIGSLMCLAFLDGDLIKTYNLWKKISPELVLAAKDNYRSRVPFKGRGIFSNYAIKQLITDNYDLERLVNTKKPLYFATSQIKRKIIKKEYEAKYFLVNYKSEIEIIQYLLASSAIPYIFDRVNIEYESYTDALKSDSEPISPLLQYNIDCIFVIPLTSAHSVERFKALKMPIIDFMSEKLIASPIINMIDFDSRKIDEYISLGYCIGDTLLKEAVNRNFFPRKKKTQYLSLKSSGITIDVDRKLTLKEIIEDSNYKRRRI